MISAKDVSLTYPDGTAALRGINFQAEPGELIYLTGPSGSGKTSLIKLLMGVEYPTAGCLTVLGKDIARGNKADIGRLRRMIGPVFQDFRLIKGRTAFDNVMLGMRFLSMQPGQMKGFARDALERVGLLHKAAARVEHLSWGECQRVAVARAIARRPALILADEPTGNLDRENSVNILELLASLRDQNTTVIITTHATHLIPETDNARHCRMETGYMLEEGPGAAL
jgi:cell division transport system ATP-binding protein